MNRLVAMDTYRGFNSSANHWNSMVSTFLYRERYKYDANGNITRADRNGNLTANPLMDSLYYRYVSGTNKLEYVDDYGVTVYGINTDLKDQSAGNYTYDAIGNLKTSVNRVITDIKWNVYGKIEHIQKGAIANATAQDLHFNYDPSGNRIGQFQRHRSGAPMYYNYMWYVRDAQGNVLAVYKVDSVGSASAGTLKLAEHHMYGSSRLGIINRDLDVDQPKHTVETPTNLGDAYLITFNRGNKLFEIGNHLGNVMLTVSDKRLPQPVGGNPSVIASYTADVVTAVDYSPFGMSLPGRIINNHWQKYRYGFNGKESDNEVNGPYNELDYGMRVYEPRLGRFLSVDPLTKSYPELTPYQYASNNPVQNIDLDGLEGFAANTRTGQLVSGGPLNPAKFPASDGWVTNMPKLSNPVFTATFKMVAKEKEVMMNNGLGTNYIGPESIVRDNIAIDQQRYGDAVADNIRGGLGGTIGYWVDGERGSFYGSAIDGVAMSFAAMPGKSSVFPKSRSMSNQPVNSAIYIKPPEVNSSSIEIPQKISSKPSTLRPGLFAKESIPATSTAQKFTILERSSINRIGNEYGCHTCGVKDPGTKSGDWIPDHQPSSKLVPPGTSQILLPHCLGCSRQQGGEVTGEKKKAAKPNSN